MTRSTWDEYVERRNARTPVLQMSSPSRPGAAPTPVHPSGARRRAQARHAQEIASGALQLLDTRAPESYVRTPERNIRRYSLNTLERMRRRAESSR
ncbi:hypothetical protein LTR17_024057 [Elasticomyces elasticus]|nr:hypothetical protein LTR17_024057 [Elasticomyces elasticus]